MKHSPCETWSSKCLFDVVMKVLLFIELVSGVKYPKITTMGFILKRPFVDVLSLCRYFLLHHVIKIKRCVLVNCVYLSLSLGLVGSIVFDGLG